MEVKTCATIQRRKSGKRKKRKSGRIWLRRKKAKVKKSRRLRTRDPRPLRS